MTDTDKRRLAWAGAVLLILASIAPLVWLHLIDARPGRWQVDLEVYRNAGISHLKGRPIYETVTPPPQLLPFTYPPFSSMLAVPLALVPFKLVGWIWYVLQALTNIAIVWIVGARWWTRPQWWRPLSFGAAVAVGFHLLPVSDGFRFGQVDAFLVFLVLADLTRWRPLRRVPYGVLIGLAAAIKLTPAIFIVYLAVTRQWRAFWTSMATAAGVTLFAAAMDLQNSLDFWFGALLDPERLGNNDGVSNQSLRGMIYRLHGNNTIGSLIWLALVALVLVVGMRIASEAHARRSPVTATGVVGLIALLISPVSWIHHHDWMLVVFASLVVLAGRSRTRWAAIGVLFVVYLLKWPWWGYWGMGSPGEFDNHWPLNPGLQLLANSYVIAALAALLLVGGWQRSARAASAPLEPAASGPQAESPSPSR
ncbi:glycosyltransferase family 87 protein [Yimella sp. cx-51]|uniref:glycosyltransferase family 87 protein n=1 Tax=Yimella sp. cx-51 TaxID=2770551 RepID=UPI00165E4E0B|nr:glycosyltransferase family 87 protein [Yimella sp. cx-51]MBC9957887.1 DUF2029 domain-containing protein [Yimella sp. cx-51]QTH38022.1 DUF2029 domain-containing protein [Yimella sp. cx-51]